MSSINFSSENFDSMFSERDAINAGLANRYDDENSVERRAPYQKRVESIILKTAKKEGALVASIDSELARLGIQTGNSVDIEPQAFLGFVLDNSELLKLSTIPIDKSRYRVSDDLSILINEADSGGEDFLTNKNTDEVSLIQYLIEKGVDVATLEPTQLSELTNGLSIIVMKQLISEVYSCQEEIGQILLEERSTYITDLKEDFMLSVDLLATGGTTQEDLDRLHQVLVNYRNIPERFHNGSLVPEFKKFIDSKKLLPIEIKNMVNELLEKDEELIFEVLGEEYFFDIWHEEIDYEETYREMFGYDQKEIWARRERNWKNVNSYITEDIKSRGALTVQDIREIHHRSTQGILPFFLHGVRSDKNWRWHISNHNKQVNSIGSKDGTSIAETTGADKLETDLLTLVEKANLVVKAKYPPFIAEVVMGNLFADYATMHPNPDGNGTNDIFFIEAIKTLRGNYLPPETYERRYISRLVKTLNNNPVALAVAAARIRRHELTHQVTRG